MKKLIFLFFALLSSLSIWGQNGTLILDYNGNFTLPDNEKYVKLEFDCSKTVY